MCGQGHYSFFYADAPEGFASDRARGLPLREANDTLALLRHAGQVLAAAVPPTWRGVLGASGSGPGRFTYPRGLAIDGHRIFAADIDKHKVHVLRRVHDERAAAHGVSQAAVAPSP